MANISNKFEETIKAHLDKRALEDTLFAATYAKENKNIKDCCAYITGRAKKEASGGCAVISDEEVFGWAIHYYDEDNIKIEKKKKELEGLDLKYRKFIQPFLNVEISEKLICIVPLESIEDFKKEGDTLHHCVYTNEYFKKSKCLILSARIEGTSIETIEIDLEKLEIIQCRGIRNQNSEYHDRIISLMRKNMKLIREIAKPKKKKLAQERMQLNSVAV